MDRDFVRRNSESRARMRAIAERLSDDALARAVDGVWTPAALLAHIAFWDRYVLERWSLAERSSTRTPVPIDEVATELVNSAALPDWIATPPRRSISISSTAAEAIDGFISSLDDGIVDAVLDEGRMRLLDRSIHRDEHLVTIEAAFSR